MEPRLNLLGNTVMSKFGKYLASANKVVADSALPAATQELVKLRASQINGCAFCTRQPRARQSSPENRSHAACFDTPSASPIRVQLMPRPRRTATWSCTAASAWETAA